MKWMGMAAALAVGLPTLATAQSGPQVEAARAPVSTVIPAGQGVVIKLTRMVNSLEFERGQIFPIALAEDVTVNGVVLLPAGTPGVGEVIHVDPAGDQARPGELLVAARYLSVQGRRVPLKGVRIIRKGMETVQHQFGGTLYIGYQAVLPPGTLAYGELAEPFDLHRDLGVTIPPPPLPDRLTRPLPAGLAPPAPGKAQVVFFRPSVGFTILTDFKVRLGPEKGAQLGVSSSGGWFVAQVDPGPREFTATQERRDSLFLDLEAGETYFVQTKVLTGLWAGHPNLFPVDRAVFAANASKMKRRKAIGE